MLRHLKPKRVIEIGSGFSSALMLDVNDYFAENKIALTFVSLLELIKEQEIEANQEKMYGDILVKKIR